MEYILRYEPYCSLICVLNHQNITAAVQNIITAIFTNDTRTESTTCGINIILTTRCNE